MGGAGLFITIAVSSIVGGLLHLDRTAAFQFLISRPLVSSTVMGLLLGDLRTGLLIGMVLELLWIGMQPLGTALPPDDTIVAVAAPAAAIIAGRLLGGIGTPLIGLSVLISLPLSAVGRLVDIELRRLNRVFLRNAKKAAREGDIGGVERQSIWGLLSFFLFFSLFSLLGILFVWLSTWLIYPYIPDTIRSALGYIFWSLPFFGAGAVLSRERAWLRFSVVFGASYVLLYVIGRTW